MVAGLYSLMDAWSQRIFETETCAQDQILFKDFFVIICCEVVGTCLSSLELIGGNVTVCDEKWPQALLGEGLNDVL